ncbi:MAG: WecB/TagA/CpsF family glycosyltransferase [Caulobacteraceae bacterium]|nr:WecB/TagA/CpsF family glycosyltransferase [Caulobacteraceae bacterium]
MNAPLAPFHAPAGPDRPARVRLLGGEVDLVTSDDVLAFTAARIAAGLGGLVVNHNLHSLHLIQRDAEMAALYPLADLIEADSTPLIAWGRLLGKAIRPEHRATYLDWREDFWALAGDRGWRVFYLGGAPGVAARGAEAVRRRWPKALIGTRDGYFDMNDAAEVDGVLNEIKAWAPNVLLVGMGMPRQEQWILRHRDRLPPCVIFPVGAAFDYEAGATWTPPRWTGRLGVEWLFRLASEPRRLFSRYLIEPWSLIGAALKDLAAR